MPERDVEGVWLPENMGWVAFDADDNPRLVRVDEQGRVRVDAEVQVGDVEVDRVRLRDADDPDRMGEITEAGEQVVSDPTARTRLAGIRDRIGEVAGQTVASLLAAVRDRLPEGLAVVDGRLRVAGEGLTDAQLRADPVEVTAHDLDEPTTTAFTGGHVHDGEVKANSGTTDGRLRVADQAVVDELTARLAPVLDPDAEDGLPERLAAQILGPLPEGPEVIGFVTDSAVLRGLLALGYAAGGPPQSTTDVVRGLLRNPAESGRVLVVAGFVVGHDEGNALIPVEVVRNPTTNEPSTSHDEMNLSMGAPAGPETSVAEFFQDTGSAMTGGDSIWLPSTGAAPNAYDLTVPAVIWPGNSVGVNFDIGALLSSGTGMVAVLWVERDEDEILELLAAHDALPEEP